MTAATVSAAKASAPKLGTTFTHPKLGGTWKVTKATTQKVWYKPVGEDGRIEAYGRGPTRHCSIDHWLSHFAEIAEPPKSKAQISGPSLTESQCAALWERACDAGLAAGEAACPEPMYVVQRQNPFDDNSPIKRAYAPVMDGVCGFAYITFPATGAFGRWARKQNLGYKGFHGGREVSVHLFNQSMERKAAFAAAAAEVLREAGIQASSHSRMD